jgi:diacylglycerol kinase family enzyme
MPLIDLICNANAGSYRRNEQLIKSIAEQFKPDLELHLTKSLADLERLAKELPGRKPAAVGIWGGDGTISQTLSAIIPAYDAAHAPLPSFLFFSGGTMNYTSKYACRQNPQEHVADVIAASKAGKAPTSRTLDLIQAGGHYGFIFGAASISDILKEYYQQGKGGMLPALGLIISLSMEHLATFGDGIFRPGKFEVAVDGKKLKRTSWNMLLAGKHGHIGMDVDVFPGVIKQPGVMGYLAADIDPLEIPHTALYLNSGGKPGRDRTYAGTCKEFTLASPKPFTYTVDGELYDSPGKLAVAMGPSIIVLR